MTTDSGSSDCRDLRMMARLARVGGPADLASMVGTQAEVTCSRGGEVRRWANGNRAKVTSSSWRYPNNQIAKVGGSWRYPNGKRAKASANSWRYPDGKPAKVSQDRWRRPDGPSNNLDDLLKWACSKVGLDKCRVHLADFNSAEGDEKDMAVIELAWMASQM
jgi:hypothetical protein